MHMHMCNEVTDAFLAVSVGVHCFVGDGTKRPRACTLDAGDWVNENPPAPKIELKDAISR